MNKRVLFFLVLVILSFSALCQEINKETFDTPEKQISFAREIKSHGYYVRQAELWWSELQKDYKSETSWFNYYRACRNAQGTADWKEDFVKESSALRLGSEIVELMQKYIPKTFTYYFVAGSTGGVASNGEFLLKAYQLNPDFEGIHSTIVTYATRTADDKLRKEANERWFKRNELSPNLMNYAYNVLMSLEPNSIILTEHDNDTYPLWMLQDVKKIRTDVSVINIDFLLDEKYRKKTFEKLKIRPLELGKIDINDYAQNWEKVVHHFVSAYIIDRPLYIAMSMSPERFEGLNSDLYISGLAYRYSKKKMNTLTLNKTLFETKFFLDYIENSFYNDMSQNSVNEMNLNYLKPLKECYDYYRKTKNTNRLNKINKIAISILNKIENNQLREKYTIDFFGPIVNAAEGIR